MKKKYPRYRNPFCPATHESVEIDTLRRLPEDLDDRSILYTRASWKSEAAKLVELLAKHRIHVGKLLGHGRYGAAFETDDPAWVVKITGDFTDAAAWTVLVENEVVGDLETAPCLPGVKCAAASPSAVYYGGHARRLFAIVQERCLPLNRKQKAFFSGSNLIGIRVEAGENIPVMRHTPWNRIMLDAEKEFGNAECMSELMVTLQELRYNWSIPLTDLHGGNIMLSPRESTALRRPRFKLTDLGYTRIGYTVDIPMISK